MENKIDIIPGKVRVRIAPSPTGHFHFGTARAALFNYLFARKYNGSFILRIEDTDLERSDEKYEKEIVEMLKWLSIEWDEGVDVGGEFSPYRQSKRLPIYAKYIQKLLDEDKVYFCFCSEKKLEKERKEMIKKGLAPKYSGKCRNFSQKEVQKKLAKGAPSVIRFKTPVKKVIFYDLIRGRIEFNSALLDDFVIAKDLFTPLYNLAVVIDDYEMKITHVIRGEDHISNTPKQILIQEALGLKTPQYAHLPLILGSDRSKLSKRHGAVSILSYKNLGYLPEALVNFMARLGWNPGDDKKIYKLKELVSLFSLKKIQKSGAIFNIEKLNWFNGAYIRHLSDKKLANLLVPFLIKKGFVKEFGKNSFKITETGEIINLKFIEKIARVEKIRLKKLSDISELAKFFFKNDSLKFSSKLLIWKKTPKEIIKKNLNLLFKEISKINKKEFKEDFLKKKIMKLTEKTNVGEFLWPLRVALSGKESSPGPFEIMSILGKEKTLKRIKNAQNLIKN